MDLYQVHTASGNEVVRRCGTAFNLMMAASYSSFSKTSLPGKYEQGNSMTLPGDEQLFNYVVEGMERLEIKWTSRKIVQLDSGHRFSLML